MEEVQKNPVILRQIVLRQIKTGNEKSINRRQIRVEAIHKERGVELPAYINMYNLEGTYRLSG
jgi:hypothetical protein